jgi:hypothetical protein
MNFDPFDDGGEATARAEVDAIRRGDPSMSDAQAAEMLVDSVSGAMVSVATGGPEIKKVDASYKREHRALGAALKRLGIDYPNKYPDLWTWHGRWSQGDMPKYSDRRVYVAGLFAPIREALADLKQATHELAKGVGDGDPTGWPHIDAQLQRLQRLFREAKDADAYNGVGLQCLKLLTSLGHVVFDAETDLPGGEEEPGADDAKARISYFVRRVVPGKEGENVRKLANVAYAQANTAKHRHTATRIDAGVAANAAALIVSTLRLLSEEDGARVEVAPGAGKI